jgi:inositol transport system permease protein
MKLLSNRELTKWVGSVLNKFSIYAILILMVLVLSIAAPRFLASKNLINIIRQMSFVAIVALGEACVIISGGIDLSVGSLIGVTTMVTASFAVLNGIPLVAVLLVGLAVGTAGGLINGLFVSKLRLPPFIATLGMLTSARGLALLVTHGVAITNVRREFNFIGEGRLLGIPVSIVTLIVFVIITNIMLEDTRFGRHLYALGGNQLAAIFSGVNIDSVKIRVYMYAGFLAGVSGILLTGRMDSGQPGAGEGFELQAIAAAVIGGTSITGGSGSAIGVLVGALIIGIINNGMALLNVNVYLEQVFTGLIIIGAVAIDSLRKK